MKLNFEQENINCTTSKIVCIGRNYVDHAIELNNPIPSSPIIFMKPPSTLIEYSSSIEIPKDLGAVHYELEIALLIGEELDSTSTRDVIESGIKGVGLALDLTLRDVQLKLKNDGHPWERAKCFPNACPISSFISAERISNWEDIKFNLYKNNNLQQQGNSDKMIFPIIKLVQHIAKNFTLNPGDIVLTGTPKGVGPIIKGDCLKAELILGQPVIETQCTIH